MAKTIIIEIESCDDCYFMGGPDQHIRPDGKYSFENHCLKFDQWILDSKVIDPGCKLEDAPEEGESGKV